MTTVQLQKIDQSFGPLKVLRALDLRVESGQYLVLLGASGGGKTTTLRVLAGLQRPDSGAVLLDEVDVTAKPPRSRDVSMVFQHDALYPHLTVERSLAFALKKKIPRGDIARRVADAARMAGIDSLLNRYPHHLSGGQLRRAAIAKAIARQSGLRLLDEPLSSLDAAARESLQSDILRWHRSLGGTTIHVTHDGQEAMRMADRIAVLSDGRIDQCDTAKAVYEVPATLAVARAIGSPPMQCFEADCDRGACRLNDAIFPNDSDGSTEAFCRLQVRDESVSRVVIAVRPESLAIHSRAPDAGMRGIGIPGRLQHAALVGREQMLTVESDGHSITALTDRSFNAKLGEQVWVSAHSDNLHVFDSGSGRRLELA